MSNNQLKYYDEMYADMILRDYLAIDRTILANERTYLSYIRTFIGFLLLGVGFIKLTDSTLFHYIGSAVAILSPLFLIIGTIRFCKMRKLLSKLNAK